MVYPGHDLDETGLRPSLGSTTIRTSEHHRNVMTAVEIFATDRRSDSPRLALGIAMAQLASNAAAK
jgi:hypothetical protein